MSVQLYNDDCVNVLKNIDGDTIDLTVTSPPYDNLREYNGNISNWNFDKFKLVASELYRITRNGGVVVWIISDATIDGTETGTSFNHALYFKSVGFNLHDTMIWHKPNPMPRDTRIPRYWQSFEYMFILSKGKPDHFTFLMEDSKHAGKSSVFHQRNPDGSMRDDRKIVTLNNVCKEKKPLGNVWSINTIASNNERTGHPAQFPVQLARDHVVSWSYENDVVLDCFMGSGTTGVACVRTRRNFIGIELDESYFNIAKRRIEKEESEISRKLF